MAADKPKPRKRNRKRKRRNVSSSSSSSSDSSSSEDEKPQLAPTKTAVTVEQDSEDSDSSSSSSSSSSSTRKPKAIRIDATKGPEMTRRRVPSRSPSPSPPTVDIPPLIPANPTTDAEKEKEKALKERFRKFWMASVADGFKDDLEEIRKEPNLSTSRLSLLIDSLASGADVFSASNQTGSNDVNEMEVVLESN